MRVYLVLDDQTSLRRQRDVDGTVMAILWLAQPNMDG
jgi:hypothetical protein